MSRKLTKDQVGATLGGVAEDVPRSGRGHAKRSIISPESVLVNLFKAEVERLRTNEALLSRIFGVMFDDTVGEADRAEFVANFMRRPPNTYMGYARQGSEFPCFAIVLGNEDESHSPLGDFLGQDERDDGAVVHEYVGAMWTGTYEIHVWAEHPDACLYLYQFAKLMMVCGHEYLAAQGFAEIQLSGGDMTPDVMSYMPEYLWARVLRARITAPNAFPVALLTKSASLTGIFRDDVVVDGVPGGVHTYEVSDEAADDEDA